ncbi:hypothetical protein CLV46_2282 [Diaminobutyricimonas aerilata]|uniref:Fibronectin type-III domain-containing protein n=1 Tax=Diaminobutyricimonas aerilata TaxID=1162967 RepID=A0A2M9CLD5_9MICO|nr:Ig-like domain-containing protein [Diaminobutyricimonas aerilata]PJJ72708.1 hypothetical protein CLV46_2282 [Diaminobutyricimonas aerilata]
MRIGAWIAGNRSLVATLTSGSVVAALVASVALTSNGYVEQRVDLDDGSVWVVNGSQQAVGRANTQVFELDTVLPLAGSDLDVLQNGSTVLVHDAANARLEVIDPATAQAGESIPLPPDEGEVFLAGDRVVVHERGSGGLWATDASELDTFDAAGEPDLALGADSVAAVDERGRAVVYSPELGQVSVVDTDSTARVVSTHDPGFDDADDVQVTTVAGRWAVLDRDSRELVVDGESIDLSDLIPADGSPQLQTASADGDRVLVAFDGGVVAAPFGGDPVVAEIDGAGEAARPQHLDGCDFAAWAGGVAWRDCGEAETLRLSGMASNPELRFTAHGTHIVLNDATAGDAWAVQAAGQHIDNWADLIDEERDEEEVTENDTTTPPETEKTQLPPVAVDDDLGARPGRSNILPVLLNDYDANGDVIVITEVGAVDESLGRIDVIAQRQQLQLTLEPTATGVLTIPYSIDDGRGGTASAVATVTVRGADENSAPAQVRPTRAEVMPTLRVTSHVLGDWIDPDADPFYLTAAVATAPDQATFKPEGSVRFIEGGGGGDRRSVALTVSDGRDSGTGSLEITVRDTTTLIADSFPEAAYAGEEKTIEPLKHVRGGRGTVTLSAVPEKTGATIVPNYDDGTFTFVSSEVRVHYLDYVVTDGDQTATGSIRVDVTAPPDPNTPPVTTPKTVFVRTLNSETLDIAGTDRDPAGGVLVVTGVSGLAPDSGVRAEVLTQSRVRVTLTAPLEGPVTFGYRISNGLAEADGSITVVEIPNPDQLQPPIARDDTASVRVGDVVDIPVLANDEQPDGEQVRLLPALVRGVPDGGGLLFASGDRLRYLAPEAAGVYTAVYQIGGPSEQTAQAEVRITVREANPDVNAPPVPRPITARVLAGETVRVEVPLTGIDPDGDSVQLLGQETNPEKGSVVSVESNVIEYEAGDYSAGTDSFTYSVIDSLGARAVGTVRVGIVPRSDGARNPVAIEDEVFMRPGGSISVQVLGNDSDPDGRELRVAAVEPNSADIAAEIIDDTVVRVTPPSAPGAYGLVYTIENAVGGTSSNFVRVIVDPEAPLAHPLADDTVLTLSDVLDREQLEVDVLRNVFFAEGDVRDLGVRVLPGWGGSAEVTADKRIRVAVTAKSQIIPFSVSHPDDDSVRSYAFIWVPGLDDALPQLDRTAPPLVVKSEETLTIDLNDRVLAVGGRGVRLTDTSSVRATHSDGSDLVVNSTTLRFVSADRYFGPASISFEVTDGATADDPRGRVATLVLPIRVEPRENQPPAFTGGVIEFEPGQQKVIDLVRLTSYPYDDDLDELAYSVVQPPQGFTARVDGQRLTLTADESAVKGTSASVGLGVRDEVNAGQPGRITLNVVASTRPLARPAPDQGLARRGASTTIDVLANDEATNPFPGSALRVTAIRGLDAGVPRGVQISPSSDNSRLSVTVADSATPGDTTLQYQVTDATGDPDRTVWGLVTVSVQDVPDAPAAPERQGGFVSGELTLRITPPAFNNAPITGYRVVSTEGGYSFDCGTQTLCRLQGLELGRSYRFQVIATNAVGDSAAGAPSVPLSADNVPPAPTSVNAVATSAAEGDLRISWPAVPDTGAGSAVRNYGVQISGAGIDERFDVSAGTTSLSTSARGITLPPNVTVVVTVFARNASQVQSDDQWARTSSPVTRTVGAPSAPEPHASMTRDPSGTSRIIVEWAPSSPNGVAQENVKYFVARSTGEGAGSCPTSAAVESSPYEDTEFDDGRQYTYHVYAYNGFFCSVGSTPPIEAKRPPGQASATLEVAARSDSGQFDVRIDSIAAPGIANKFQYRLSANDDWKNVSRGDWLTEFGSVVYGTPFSVTVRACRDASDTYCGPESAATAAVVPIDTRADVASCAPAQLPQLTAPNNAGVAPDSFVLAYEIPEKDIFGVPTGGWEWTDFNYASDTAAPEGARAARVKATVATYQDPGYGEGACTP